MKDAMVEVGAEATRARTAWRAGLVRRWHANPDMSDQHDEVAAHMGRCVLLALTLWPDASRDLLMAISAHDAAEWRTGDVPYLFREEHPGFASDLADFEFRTLEAMGLDFALTPLDVERLIFLDRLDPILFVRHRRPHLLEREDWRRWRSDVVAQGRDLGVDVETMLS